MKSLTQEQSKTLQRAHERRQWDERNPDIGHVTSLIDAKDGIVMYPISRDLMLDASKLQDLAIAQDAIITQLTMILDEQKAALDKCMKLRANELKTQLVPTSMLVMGDENKE